MSSARRRRMGWSDCAAARPTTRLSAGGSGGGCERGRVAPLGYKRAQGAAKNLRTEIFAPRQHVFLTERVSRRKGEGWCPDSRQYQQGKSSHSPPRPC